MKKLETEHLILRKAVMDDLDSIWKNVWSREELTKYMLWEVTSTRQEAILRLEKTIEYQKNHPAYFVCLKENNQAIGFAGVVELKENGVYSDTGICIGTDYQGRGYGKEVIRAFKKLIFEELRGENFIYSCMSENEASHALCISQGFLYFQSEPGVRKYDQLHYIDDCFYFSREMYFREKND